jgi:hypothetical protein
MRRLVAGEATGLATLLAVRAIRGTRKPVFVEATSSIAEASGFTPVAFIPIF